MPASVTKKPATWKDQQLFDANAEPRARPDEWRFDAPAPSIGTLPREIYQALCVLRAYGPCNAEKLEKHIVKYYDWDPMRIMRVIQRLASCGYVTMGDGGLLSVRPEP